MNVHFDYTALPNPDGKQASPVNLKCKSDKMGVSPDGHDGGARRSGLPFTRPGPRLPVAGTVSEAAA